MMKDCSAFPGLVISFQKISEAPAGDWGLPSGLYSQLWRS
jgi:hypothetical protein